MPAKPKRHELRDQKYRKAHGIERSMRPRPIMPERHLFVTEGKETEPNYLYGMIDKICEKYGQGARKQFQVIGEGGCTLNLLNKAETYQKNDADGFQHVWIIYDKDDFPSDAFDNTVNRCEELNKQYQKEGKDMQFHAIWSNQCVELWFLLHYNYMISNITRKAYRNNLTQCLGRRYNKSDKTIFQTLLPKIDDAVKNSERLMNYHPKGCPPSAKVPCTNFHELIKFMRKYF